MAVQIRHTPAEIAVAMRAAGFPEDKIREGVAVAWAESTGQSGQSNLYSEGQRELSFGPWQIHLPAHPDVTIECANDLECSTRKAFDISHGGTNFAAWSAWKSGAYRQFLDLVPDIHLPTASDGGGAAPSGAAPGNTYSDGSSGDYSCGLTVFDFDIINTMMVERHLPPAQIATEMTARLGRQITVACMRHDAYGIARSVGESIDGALGLLPGVAAVKTASDLLKPENLWRGGLVLAGALLLYFGARLYLHDAPEGGQLETA